MITIPASIALLIQEMTPATKLVIIAGTSGTFGLLYAITNRTRSFGYDTITYLKRRAKKFKKNNYNESRKQ